MNLRDFYRKVGGTVLYTTDPNDPSDVVYNFGLCTKQGEPVRIASELVADTQRRPIYTVAPNVQGRWDGKTDVSLWEVGRKLLGNFLPAQKQTIGSCGGRAVSGSLNCLQLMQIVEKGSQEEFFPVSHAWCYGGARELEGGLGGGEGVIPPSPVTWCEQNGVVHQKESGDTDYNSDRFADEWGRRGVPRNLLELGRDNLISEVAICTGYNDAADVIASGGVVAVASDQGFTMTRDREGVCRPEGTWMHYMYFASVHRLPSGRRVLGCGQSWGQNVPDGPTLPGCPDYVFGVDEATVNRMLRQRTSSAIGFIAGWKSPNIPWMFLNKPTIVDFVS